MNNMKKFFRTKKQIVKVANRYAARYKKWYQLSWRYTNCRYSYKRLNGYVLFDTRLEAVENIDEYFSKHQIVEVIQ